MKPNEQAAFDLLQKGSQIGALLGNADGVYSLGAARDLRKAIDAYSAIHKATIGTLPATFGALTQDQAALVPQDLRPMLTLLGAQRDDMWLNKKLAVVPVTSFLFEDTTTTAVGTPHVHGIVSEGGAAMLHTGTHKRDAITVRVEGVQRSVTDQGTWINMQGYQNAVVGKNALMNEDFEGMLGLERLHECNLWNMNAAYDTEGYDGLLSQILGLTFTNGLPSITADTNNFYNADGNPVAGEDLVGFAANISGGPNFARLDTCAMHPALWGVLEQLGQAARRTNAPEGGKPVQGDRFVFGADSIWITGPRGKIMIESAPLICGEEERNSLAEGGGVGSGEAAPDISGVTFTVGAGIAVAPHASSRFVAADAGAYKYRITAIGRKGISKPLVVPTDGSAITVAAGDAVTFDFPSEPTHGTGNSQVLSYLVERTTVDGATSTSSKILEYPVNTVVGGARTRIIDANLFRPGTAPIVMLENDPKYLYYGEIIPPFRRPLPAVNTTQPFMILRAGVPRVKARGRHFVVFNAKKSL